MNKNQFEKGFTVIEILFVILIIIILAGISILALNGQRAKARDARRVDDVRQVQTALEFYYSDENEYPIVSQSIILGNSQAIKLCSKDEGGFVTSETVCNQDSMYMSQVPKDPQASKIYLYTGDENGYDITYVKEKDDIESKAGTYHAHSESTDLVPGNR